MTQHQFQLVSAALQVVCVAREQRSVTFNLHCSTEGRGTHLYGTTHSLLNLTSVTVDLTEQVASAGKSSPL